MVKPGGPVPTQERAQTELEGALSDAHDTVEQALEHARSIAYRVLPPPAEKTAAGLVCAVNTTYHQRVRLIVDMAAELRDLLAEMNGRI